MSWGSWSWNEKGIRRIYKIDHDPRPRDVKITMLIPGYTRHIEKEYKLSYKIPPEINVLIESFHSNRDHIGTRDWIFKPRKIGEFDKMYYQHICITKSDKFEDISTEELQFEDAYHLKADGYSLLYNDIICEQKSFDSANLRAMLRDNNNAKLQYDKNNPNKDYMIQNPPDSSIECVKLCPAHDILATISGENIYFYRYDVDRYTQQDGDRIILQHNYLDKTGLQTINFKLCCCWDTSGSYLFVGGNNIITIASIGNKSDFQIFARYASDNLDVSCLQYAKTYNLLISGSQDGILTYWDMRCNTNYSMQYTVDGRIDAIAQRGNKLIVGLYENAEPLQQIYDIRKCQQCISEIPFGDKFKCFSQSDIEMFSDEQQWITNLRSIADTEVMQVPNSRMGLISYGYCIKYIAKSDTFLLGDYHGMITLWNRYGKQCKFSFWRIEGVEIDAIDFDQKRDILCYATGPITDCRPSYWYNLKHRADEKNNIYLRAM